jgi:uncharacterized Fe-S radical SAM superfamily protein PflX
MVHKYFEIKEDDWDEETEIRQIIRINVETDEEAESLLQEHKNKFKIPNAMVVEGDHKVGGKSLHCRKKLFDKNGKLEVEYNGK